MYDRDARKRAQAILRPENFPPETLAYIADYTTLNQIPITSGQIIGASRYAWTIDTLVTQLVVNSSVAETTVYSYTLGGGTLGTQGAVQLIIMGDYLNSSGSTSTFQLKVKYGATTMYDGTSAARGSFANRAPHVLDVTISAANATNSQFVHGFLSQADRTSAATTGLGPIDTAGTMYPISGTAAEDSTLNKAVTVTVKHSNNSANTSYRRNYATLTKVGH